jgi:hypothetical protein
MKPKPLLTTMSLIAIALVLAHVTDDFILGFDKGVVNNPYGIAIFGTWMVGVLVLREHLAGRIILLLGGLFALAMPVLHLRGRGYGDPFRQASAAFRYVWTLYALGVLGVVIIILSVRELIKRRTDPADTRVAADS